MSGEEISDADIIAANADVLSSGQCSACNKLSRGCARGARRVV
jgi:hypothetical protein